VSALLLLMPLVAARAALLQYGEQQKAYDATLRSLITAIEIKDGYTRGHSERVSQIAVMIAQAAHLPQYRVEAVRYGALLHDVGKTGIPSRILAKHGKLTEEEFAVIKTHPDRGVQMLDGIDFLSDSIAGVYHHHERMDGRGYPLGLAGDEVPEIARIIMVADAFDAMTSTRSYRPARSTDKAIAELRRCQGDQFDPRMVDALVAGVDKHGWEGDPEPFSATPVADDHAHEFAPAAVGVIPAQVDASHS
jgi:putative nucleotidyltransferase with HDIG domain